MIEMDFDGAGTAGQVGGNFLVGVTLGEEPEDFALAGGQFVLVQVLGGWLAKDGNHPPGDLAAHGRAPVHHFQDGPNQFGGRKALEQVTAGAGFTDQSLT